MKGISFIVTFILAEKERCAPQFTTTTTLDASISRRRHNPAFKYKDIGKMKKKNINYYWTS